jgi:hypothetical protein
VWSDEFDGTALDTTKWGYLGATYGQPTRRQTYRTQQVQIHDGVLHLVAERKASGESTSCVSGPADCDFWSGGIQTKSAATPVAFPTFGTIEARIRMPQGQGLWPAFWLTHYPNGGSTAEVDIMEIFHSTEPGRARSTLWLDRAPGASYSTKRTQQVYPWETGTPQWHVWSLTTSPEGPDVRFRISLDGTLVLDYLATNTDWLHQGDQSRMWNIILNQQIDGQYVGDPDGTLGVLDQIGKCAQGGTYPNACKNTGILRAQFPSSMDIDYVRVWR